MKRIFSLLAAVLTIAVLSGCGKEDRHSQEEGPSVLVELIEAYQDGRVFSSAEHTTGRCAVRFKDSHQVEVPETEFVIHDCRQKNPAEVMMNGGWWMVGNVTMGIRYESSVPDTEASLVYAYFDAITIYLHLNNGHLLKFPSEAQEELDRIEQENARRQTIPVVRIETDGGAGIYDKKNYVKGSITIEDPVKMYGEVETFTARMGIRGRGNSTWGWPKKPWKVKLDEKASLLGMPADKEWALLANYSDRTLVRNITAMKLSEICGFSWTPRMRSVEVYLNGTYQGVYTLCEHKKVSDDRVNIDVVSESDNAGDALTGGYYLEMEENQDETTCWWTAMGVPMMFSDPEEPTSEQYAYMTGYIDEFKKVLQGAGFADPVSGYAKYIDVRSFINYYIVQELTKNVDGNLRKSSFITKERGKKMEMYHLWDFDLTLGNCGYFDWKVGNGPENFWIKDYRSNSTYGGGWFWHLFKDPAFVHAVQERWNELMPELEKIPAFIDEQVFGLTKAQKRNFDKWSINDSVDWVMFPSLGSYEKEVEYLKYFYTARLEWLDREINKL